MDCPPQKNFFNLTLVVYVALKENNALELSVVHLRVYKARKSFPSPKTQKQPELAAVTIRRHFNLGLILKLAHLFFLTT